MHRAGYQRFSITTELAATSPCPISWEAKFASNTWTDLGSWRFNKIGLFQAQKLRRKFRGQLVWKSSGNWYCHCLPVEVCLILIPEKRGDTFEADLISTHVKKPLLPTLRWGFYHLACLISCRLTFITVSKLLYGLKLPKFFAPPNLAKRQRSTHSTQSNRLWKFGAPILTLRLVETAYKTWYSYHFLKCWVY